MQVILHDTYRTFVAKLRSVVALVALYYTRCYDYYEVWLRNFGSILIYTKDVNALL